MHMKIGLFGAAFDPPHLGHQTVVDAVLSHQLFDEVWLVPVKQHPFAKELSDEDDRLAMLELILINGLKKWVDQNKVRIETYELDTPGVSASYRTLSYFKALRPTDTFAWIIGADNIAGFNRWHEYQKLLSEFEVYVYPRPGFSMDQLLPGMVPLHEVPEVDVSSTKIRQAVKTNQAINDLVEANVGNYISEHKLYLLESAT
jgi:nicotinate (nicotinamide) nucleotide adenylyltransferase